MKAQQTSIDRGTRKARTRFFFVGGSTTPMNMAYSATPRARVTDRGRSSPARAPTAVPPTQPGTAITNLKFDKIFRDTVVRVISYGKNWTLVDYNGMRGYVSSGALEFFCNDHTEFDPAYVSVKGKIKGKEPVQLRARVNYGILETQANMGTQITVFDVIEGFAEIDVEGKHCMINEKYVTFEKDLAAAE